jgi:RNA polymerase sigma factor (sigma-70 family)
MAVDALAQAPMLDAAFAAHRRFLWALCYRLTGSAADADDLVQDTFVRAVERPPARTGEPLRPWLVRVALNLGRDLLRRRRRRRYVGPWLPSPVEGDEPGMPSVEPHTEGWHTTEGRYDLLESVSFAFLLALEALTPLQRAVLLLRDVFDYTTAECADALGASAANVKVTLHRARRRMAAYDGRRPASREGLEASTRAALGRFVDALGRGDLPALEALLAADVLALSDGAGEVTAARVPLRGAARVARFYTTLLRKHPRPVRSEVRTVNGLPALVSDFGAGRPHEPARGVILFEVDPSGRIAAVYSVLAPAKLAGVAPVA